MWRGPLFASIMAIVCVLPWIPFCRSCGANSYHRRRNLGKNPLKLNQRLPNMAEFAMGASGPATGKVPRRGRNNSTLVPCYNTNIVFKDDEGTGADRLMTRTCRAKLNQLARLVKNDPEWSKLKPPIRLRVIEAWDEDDQHSKHSLHYEGRAVDITTSDRDEAKYGKLGRLAYEAGFDWVYYAERTHIHASVRKDGSSKTEAYKGCFSADSRVKLANGQSVAMKDLQIGDKVESMTNNGEITFSEVLMFIDNRPRVPGVSHWAIETENAKEKIVLTPTHLIFTLESSANRSRSVVKHAKSVKVGEFILAKDSSGKKLAPKRVTKVYLERKTGAIAPLTSQGNIIVDDILASCYAMTNDHGLAHFAFSPVRFWHLYSPAMFKWNYVPQSGTHWYADFLIMLNSLLGVTSLS